MSCSKTQLIGGMDDHDQDSQSFYLYIVHYSSHLSAQPPLSTLKPIVHCWFLKNCETIRANIMYYN